MHSGQRRSFKSGNHNFPSSFSLLSVERKAQQSRFQLRQGCLKPVKVIIPKGSLLDPSEEAAVVGGNVLTSQRVVDVVLRAFGACAASQGCMNNVTLGTEEWGYYETVAGGSGAEEIQLAHFFKPRHFDSMIVRKRVRPGTAGEECTLT